MPENVNGFIWFASICFTSFFSTKEIRVYQQRPGVSELRSDITKENLILKLTPFISILERIKMGEVSWVILIGE